MAAYVSYFSCMITRDDLLGPRKVACICALLSQNRWPCNNTRVVYMHIQLET